MPTPSPGYAIDTGSDRLEVVVGFLSTAYGSSQRTREVVERSVAGSLCFGLYRLDGARDGRGAQVGFARVVTDRATFAYLADVFVLDAHRGRGLGKALMAAVTDHPDLQGLRRWSLVTSDAHGLYRSFGFRPVASPESHMERIDPAR